MMDLICYLILNSVQVLIWKKNSWLNESEADNKTGSTISSEGMSYKMKQFIKLL